MRACGVVVGILVSVYFAQVGQALAQAGQPAEKRKPRPASTTQTPAPSSNWTGLQTGANGGNSSLAQNFAEPGAFLCPLLGDCSETPFNFSGHPSSFTAGGFAGYREQFGQLVLGIEADVAWKKATTSYVQSGVTPLGVTETFTGSMTQGWDGSLRGRLGFLLTPALLAYGTSGLAFGNVSGSFSYNAQYGPISSLTTVTGAGSWNDIRIGYTVGGGIELDVGMGLKARLEYRFTDFGRISKDVPLTSTDCSGYSCGTNAHIDMDAAFHTVRLGLGVDL
jgi:outer membrane immunogenic protein